MNIRTRAIPEGRLLLIEDEPEIGLLIERVAQPIGFETRIVRQIVDVRDAVTAFRPTAILTDLNIIGGKDCDVICCLVESSTVAPVVVMSRSGYRRAAKVEAAHLRLNVVGFLDKPFSLCKLREILESLKAAIGTQCGQGLNPDSAKDDETIHGSEPSQ